MTCIVKVKSKKQLVDDIKEGKNIIIEDPSIFNPRSFWSNNISEGEKIVVTNHPKRSFFAIITKKNGSVLVK